MFEGAAPRTWLADYRAEVLHEQSPAEARRMKQLAGRLRWVLKAAGLSRRQFAEQSGLALDLIVAVENGYGRVETGERVLALARAGVEDR